MTLVRKDKTGGFLEVRHYKDLLIQLVSRDLKLKYRRSVLGYVWSVLNPLLIMLVMYVVRMAHDTVAFSLRSIDKVLLSRMSVHSVFYYDARYDMFNRMDYRILSWQKIQYPVRLLVARVRRGTSTLLTRL